jgi:hypothetical protein
LLISAQQGDVESERQDDTLPLSDVVVDQIAEVESVETIVVLDIPEKLDFSPRETHIYSTIMEAIADACGGRETAEFTRIAAAIESALIEIFGEANTEDIE